MGISCDKSLALAVLKYLVESVKCWQSELFPAIWELIYAAGATGRCIIMMLSLNPAAPVEMLSGQQISLWFLPSVNVIRVFLQKRGGLSVKLVEH